MADMPSYTQRQTIEPFSAVQPAPYVDVSSGFKQAGQAGLNELQKMSDAVMEQQGRQDGLNAGLDRDANGNPTMKMLAPISSYGRAYNAGAEAAYTSNLASDAEKSIETFKEQFQDAENGTAQYAAAWKTYKDKTLSAVAPELRGYAEMKLNAVGTAGLNSVSQYQYQRTREMQYKAITSSIASDESKLVNLALTNGVDSPQFKLAMDEWAHKQQGLVEARFQNAEQLKNAQDILNSKVTMGVAVGSFRQQFMQDMAKGPSNAANATVNLVRNIDAWLNTPGNADNIPPEQRKSFLEGAVYTSYELANKTIQAAHEQQFNLQVQGHIALSNVYAKINQAAEAKDMTALAALKIESQDLLLKYPMLAAQFNASSIETKKAINAIEGGVSNMAAYRAQVGLNPKSDSFDNNTQNLDNILPMHLRDDAVLAKHLKDSGYQGSVEDFKYALRQQSDQSGQIAMMNHSLQKAQQGASYRETLQRNLGDVERVLQNHGTLNSQQGELYYETVRGQMAPRDFVARTGYISNEIADTSVSSRNPANVQNAMDVLQAAKNSGRPTNIKPADDAFWSTFYPKAQGATPAEKMQNAIKDFNHKNEGYQNMIRPDSPEMQGVNVRSLMKSYGEDFGGWRTGGKSYADVRPNTPLAIGQSGFDKEFKEQYLFQRNVVGKDEKQATLDALQAVAQGPNRWGVSNIAVFNGNVGDKAPLIASSYQPVLVKNPVEQSQMHQKDPENGIKYGTLTALYDATDANPKNLKSDGNPIDRAASDLVTNGRYNWRNKDNLLKIVFDEKALSYVADASTIGTNKVAWNIQLRNPNGQVETIGQLPDYNPHTTPTPFALDWANPKATETPGVDRGSEVEKQFGKDAADGVRSSRFRTIIEMRQLDHDSPDRYMPKSAYLKRQADAAGGK